MRGLHEVGGDQSGHPDKRRFGRDDDPTIRDDTRCRFRRQSAGREDDGIAIEHQQEFSLRIRLAGLNDILEMADFAVINGYPMVVAKWVDFDDDGAL